MNDSATDGARDPGLVGQSLPRRNARRLVEGRGAYVDDLSPPNLVHVCYLRSPYAHARIVSLDATEAMASPGVVRVFTGADLAEICTPWTGVLEHLVGLRSAPQPPLAADRALWQGEPVAAVVAQTRAQAEDAVELIDVEWEELPVVVDPEFALSAEAPAIHPSLGDNLAYERTIEVGEDGDADGAGVLVEQTLRTGRHTGVCLEPRSILADFCPSERRLTCHVSNQSPHMLRALFARHLGLDESDVRVISRDVGGSFGIKVHLYGDEIATAAMAMVLGRPVKFVADRLESFTSDIHSRDHLVAGRIRVSEGGEIRAFEIDDLSAIGAYSAYPRGSANEAKQIVNLVGAPYRSTSYRARTRLAFQNKPLLAQYRSVGHPVACLVTEALVDRAAAVLDIDPVEFRRRNLVPDDAYPHRTPSGVVLEGLSHQKSLDLIVETMRYDALRREQAALREQGVHRGIGLAVFIEMTNPSHATYGVGGAPITSSDTCVVRLLPNGGVACSTGITEQGQGTEAIIAQVTASAVGIALDRVRVQTGDTDAVPFGSGTWGSRGAGIGGEAALQAGKELRSRILSLAGALLQSEPGDLDIRSGVIVDRAGSERMSVEEIARITYYRTDLLPPDVQPELTVSRSYRQAKYDGIATNGVQASHVEVDPETGFVSLLHHWVVEDCGVPINPLLVEEQIRGGVVQGLGAALFEECLYDENGQLLNGNLADYLVPMAAEMPDITVGHVVTPTGTSELGAKGAGEAGTAGAAAAVLNAVNDALRPLGGYVNSIPITPEKILRTLGHI